jgi:hypothetical protein
VVEAASDNSPQGRTLSFSLSLSLSLVTLVTPTASTPVQDNISLIPSLVFHLASTHLGRDTWHQNSLVGPVEGPPGPKHRQYPRIIFSRVWISSIHTRYPMDI